MVKKWLIRVLTAWLNWLKPPTEPDAPELTVMDACIARAIADALRERVDGWLPLNKCPAPLETLVIVSSPEKNFVGEGLVYPDKPDLFETDIGAIRCTHWQPMPRPLGDIPDSSLPQVIHDSPEHRLLYGWRFVELNEKATAWEKRASETIWLHQKLSELSRRELLAVAGSLFENLDMMHERFLRE